MYRLKHHPSGLYFCPARKILAPGGKYFDYIKSNLSQTGKVYHRRPSIAHVGGSYYNPTLPARDALASEERYLYPVIESEWLVEAVV